MKKSFWVLGMAVAALTSCTQSELVEVSEGRMIKFDTYVEKGSRAEALADETPLHELPDMTPTTIKKFWAYGDKFAYNNFNTLLESVFENEEVAHQTDGSWKYTGLKYWQSDMSYRFAAYSDANNMLEDYEEANGGTPATGQVDYESQPTSGAADYITINDYVSDGGKDLVAAIVNDRHTNVPGFNTTINFPFRHMLAKVVIQFQSDKELTTSHLKIQDVQLNDLFTKGDCTYTFTNATEQTTNPVAWTGHDVVGDYTNHKTVEREGTTPVSEFLVSPTTKCFVFYVIPQNFASTTSQVDGKDVVTYTHAPKLTFTAKSYSGEFTEDEILGSATNTPTIHVFNEEFILDPKVNGGSQYARWAPGYVYIYNVTYTQAATEEKPIIFGTPTMSVWGNVISGGLPLTPNNDGLTENGNK